MKPTKLDSPVEFIGPVDEDLLLTLAVLQHNARTHEVAEFERRYVVEDAFRRSVGPLVALWLAPFDLRDVVAEAQGAPVAARRSAGVPLAFPGVDALPARPQYGAPPVAQQPRRFSTLKDLGILVLVLIAAAGFAWIAAVGYQVYLYQPPKSDGVIEVQKVSPDTLTVPKAPAGSTKGNMGAVRKKAA